MPLFEFGASQLEDGGIASGRVAQVVEANLDGLVGEQVFRVVRADTPDQPFLIALDPSGAPVVVEVVQTLDSAMLIRALDHAGAAGRMTRGQLASQYPGGTQAFLHHLAGFMDSVPVKRARMPRSGSRLIIICEDTSDDVLNAVDFLRQPAMPVEVLRLDRVNALGGRKFLDLSPLVINPDSAPDRPRLFGQTPQLEATREPDVAEPPPSAPTPVVRPAPAMQRPAVERLAVPERPAAPDRPAPAQPAPLAERPAIPERSVAPDRPAAAERAADLAVAVAAAQRAVKRAETVIAVGAEASKAPTVGLETRRQRRERLEAERKAEFAARRVEAQRVAVTEAARDVGAVIPALPDVLGGGELNLDHLATGLQTGVPIPLNWQPEAMPAGLTIDGVLAAGTEASDPLSWDTAQLPVVVSPMATGPIPRVPAEDGSSRADEMASGPVIPTPVDLPVRPARPRGHHSMPGNTATADGLRPIDDRPDADLVLLAGRLGQPTALVWERPRRRQRFAATLDPFGTIHVNGVGFFHNPDAAARAAAGNQSSDGWTSWRIGSGTGPTLREALTNATG